MRALLAALLVACGGPSFEPERGDAALAAYAAAHPVPFDAGADARPCEGCWIVQDGVVACDIGTLATSCGSGGGFLCVDCEATSLSCVDGACQ